jgi:hypothetical protein
VLNDYDDDRSSLRDGALLSSEFAKGGALQSEMRGMVSCLSIAAGES